MLRLFFAVAATTFLFAGFAHADDMPHQLTQELVRTEIGMCPTSTGYGRNFVVMRDIDGDGRKDVILDYSQAECGGQPDPYCTAAGCLLKVYLGSKSGGYTKAFDGRARTWRLDESRGRAALVIDGAVLTR